MSSHSFAPPTLNRLSPLVLALVLDAAALALFAGFLVRLAGRGTVGADETLFSDPLAAALVVTAASLAILAGVVAGVALVREPLRTRTGSWAARLAVANAFVLPILAAVAGGVAWAVGIDDPALLAQPLAPLWMLAGLAAAVLGATAHEPGRRGLLVLPFMLGALVLVFWVGELVVPH